MLHCVTLALGLQLGGQPAALTRARSLGPPPRSQICMSDPWAASSGGIDMNTVFAVVALVGGVGGGIGLIAFAEGAGKRNEEVVNQQPCVDCSGEKVVTCRICEGTGEDPLASLVAGVRREVDDEGTSESARLVTVEDWDSGPKQIVMYEDILSKYPVKAVTDICTYCEGRGVVVCDNCQGSGLQPRFLERFSPDDFMD